jgi:hypothetical protein
VAVSPQAEYTAVNLSSIDSYSHEAEFTAFQTKSFSENLVAPGIEPRPLDLLQGTLTTRSQKRYVVVKALHCQPEGRAFGTRRGE